MLSTKRSMLLRHGFCFTRRPAMCLHLEQAASVSIASFSVHFLTKNDLVTTG